MKNAKKQRFEWQLAIYDPTGDHSIPLNEYFESKKDWTPSLEDCTFVFYSNGKEWLSNHWNLGNIELISEQLKEAKKNLEIGKMAIIRSAVDDQPDVPYLIFMPTISNTVEISLFFISHPEIKYYYPLSHDQNRSKRTLLIEYINQNLVTILAPVSGYEATYSFRKIPFPSKQLIISLQEIIELVSRLFKQLKP